MKARLIQKIVQLVEHAKQTVEQARKLLIAKLVEGIETREVRLDRPALD